MKLENCNIHWNQSHGPFCLIPEKHNRLLFTLGLKFQDEKKQTVYLFY